MNEGVTVIEGGFAAHVYDGVGFRNKPDLPAEGLAPARIAYSSEMWLDPDVAGEMPSEQAVKDIARGVEPGAILILDIEQWNVQKDPSNTEQTIDNLLEIVGWVRSVNPEVQVGFFGLAPLSNYFREINYAKRLDDPTLPRTPDYIRVYQEYQALNDQMARLANAVDFICPVLYTLEALSGPQDEYRQIWDVQAANAIREAQQYGKPVLPFLWPQFFDSNAGNDHKALPADFWLHQLEFVEDQGANGAIIWGSETFRSEGWNDLDPWWAATKAFLSDAASRNDLLGDGSDNLIADMTGNDHLFGFDGDDVLTGGAGANLLSGGEGSDRLHGGEGADTLEGGPGADVLDGGGGLDTASYASAPAGVVVSLLLQGIPQVTAGAGVDTLTSIENLMGSNFNDVLTGDANANVLDGGPGADTMIGGGGNDRYMVSSAGDKVVESPGQGADTVLASVSYTLPLDVENLQLIGARSVNATGNARNNVLTGNSGHNALDGRGGADTMAGGLGDDTYYVDRAGDVVSETAGGGKDTVVTSVSYALSAASEVEVLRTYGSSTTASIDLTGNAFSNTLIGNAAANRLNGGAGADTMIGELGDDRYYVDSAGDVVLETAGGGNDTVITSVDFVLSAGSEVELLRTYGSSTTASITLTGNEFSNTLVGNASNNRLDGGGGVDIMVGTWGHDAYVVDNAGDKVVENPGQGIDIVLASVSYTLPSDVEYLQLIGTSSVDATGNALNNGLIGNGGNNALDGKGGADTMEGGLGDDTYYVDRAGDAVSETVGGGKDTVITAVSYVLGTGSEVEVLRTYGSSTTVPINLTGNEFGNTLIGNAAANRLNGAAGADTMMGGLGDDRYYVDSADDVVSETAGGGNDTVITGVSYVLSAGAEVELLRTYGSSTTAPIDLTGNELSNTLSGNAGANWLNGAGGADYMSGRLGDDTYVVDDVGDKVVENPGEGIDTVLATLSYVLPVEVENLLLTGTHSVDATGNARNNALTGNSGHNVLDGKGGADTMAGGLGDDTYHVNNIGDVVSEAVGGGRDTVITGISYSLSAGSEVELLRTYGSSTTAPIDLTGNEFRNTLMGNAAANRLDGGAGADILHGAGGADLFVLGPDTSSADTLADFTSSEGDRVVLRAADFGLTDGAGMTDGALSPDWFETGPSGTKAHGEFLFDAQTHTLSWDADGVGPGAALALATFGQIPGVPASDFLHASDFVVL